MRLFLMLLLLIVSEEPLAHTTLYSTHHTTFHATFHVGTRFSSESFTLCEDGMNKYKVVHETNISGVRAITRAEYPLKRLTKMSFTFHISQKHFSVLFYDNQEAVLFLNGYQLSRYAGPQSKYDTGYM